MICNWEPATLLIFSKNVEVHLIYYSHLTSILIFLCLFGLTFLKLKEWPKGSFRLMTLSYAAWLFCDLVLWANPEVEHVLFFWTLINLIEPLIFFGAFGFFYSLISNKPLTLKTKYTFLGFLIPTLIMAVMNLSVMGFDLTNCDRNVVEGIAAYYNYILEGALIILVIIFAALLLLRKDPNISKSKTVLAAMGTSCLMFSFLFANFLGTLLTEYDISQYGHMAVPVFAIFLTYVTIQYESFEPRIALIDILVGSLMVLLVSLFFVRNEDYQLYIMILTFVLSIPLAYTLVTGIRKEVYQRKELARLNIDLEDLIKQRESLVHLVTHKVKGSFTRSKYIFAGILDGTFGEINPEVKKRAEQGLESDNMGIETVDLVLSVANMQKGVVKYDMKEFDLKDSVLKTISEKTVAAEAKGLKIENDIKDGVYKVVGDAFWLKEVFNNLIENSIKYTQTGKLTVGLEKKENKVIFSVKDTGIGITDEDKKNLFTEGGRGKDSVKVNVDSTGYGLFSVKLIVDAHKGRVWAESEGAGLGSQFYVELPAQ